MTQSYSKLQTMNRFTKKTKMRGDPDFIELGYVLYFSRTNEWKH